MGWSVKIKIKIIIKVHSDLMANYFISIVTGLHHYHFLLGCFKRKSSLTESIFMVIKTKFIKSVMYFSLVKEY